SVPLQPPVPKTTPFKFITASSLQYIDCCIWFVFGLYIPLLWLPWIWLSWITLFIQPFTAFFLVILCIR
ncbi:hypothetical protein FB192DRAFT_1356598, partial [Mucor lusitanicus]